MDKRQAYEVTVEETGSVSAPAAAPKAAPKAAPAAAPKAAAPAAGAGAVKVTASVPGKVVKVAASVGPVSYTHLSQSNAD